MKNATRIDRLSDLVPVAVFLLVAGAVYRVLSERPMEPR